MMRWLLTSRSADGTWRLPLLQFLLLIALMLFILATFIVLGSQREPVMIDRPGAQQQADDALPLGLRQTTIASQQPVCQSVAEPPQLLHQPVAEPPQLMHQAVSAPSSLIRQSVSAPPSSSQIRLSQAMLQPVVSTARSQPVEAAASNAIKGTVTLSGGVRYFHGQTNERGQTLPLLPLAFLAGERINVVMDFTAEPSSITITLKDMTMTISGVLGQTHYETWLIIPEWERTIDWNGARILPTLTMNVHAISRANPLVQTDVAIPGLDIGGSVYDILIMQIA